MSKQKTKKGARELRERCRSTILMPFYKRLDLFEHYASEQLWDDANLLVVCDGSEQEVVQQLRSIVAAIPGSIQVHWYQDNRGLAGANAVGADLIETPFYVSCDDDDFLLERPAFLAEAEEVMDRDEDALFVTMPKVVAFDMQLNARVQYDRRHFHGVSGRDLLEAIVRSGEIQALNAGTLYRTDDIRRIPSEAFFEVSEDYVRLARLCAMHPDRKIHVASSGCYMRLMHNTSLSARTGYGPPKQLMHLVSMIVGAYYLVQRGEMRPFEMGEILLRRGEALERSYGNGRAVVSAFWRYLAGQSRQDDPISVELWETLDGASEKLPPEFLRFREMLQGGVDPQVQRTKIASNEPLVSIIIPCFNYGRYVQEAIESAIGQTYPNIEIIFVDDGSTDNSLAIAQKVAADHPESELRILSIPNSGQPAVPRNHGIENARGEYILCLDADDRIAPEMVETCLRELQRQNGVSIAYVDRQDFGDYDTLSPALEYDFEYLKKRNFFPYCALFPRKMWEDIGGFRLNVKGVEDWDFWVAAGARGYYGQRIPLPLFYYRRHGSGLFDSIRNDFELKVAQVVLNNKEVYEPTQVQWAQQKFSSARPHSSDMRPITLFTIPKAFKGHSDIIQRNAIRSWTRLVPKPEIILLGNDEGTAELASELGLKHIPDVKCSPGGTPLVSDIFEKALQHGSGEVFCYLNADIILLSDFCAAVATVSGHFTDYLLAGRRTNLDVSELIDFENPQWESGLRKAAQERGQLYRADALDYFVFTRNLLSGIPPFAIGRAGWDNWMVVDPILRDKPVVDASDTILVVHQNHDYNHVAGGQETAYKGAEAQRNRELAGPYHRYGYVSIAPWFLRAGQLENRYEGTGQTPKSYLRMRLATTLVENGLIQYKENRFAQALVHFDEAARTDPSIESLHYYRAVVLIKLGRTIEAKDALYEELRHHPKHEAAKDLLDNLFPSRPPVSRQPESEVARLFDEARTAIQAGNYKEGLAQLSRIKSKRLVLENLDFIRAVCFLKMNQFADAKEALREELQYFPGNADARSMLEQVLVLRPDRGAIQDPEFVEMLAEIRPHTMVTEPRLYSLFQNARRVLIEDLPGNFVECGVARGGTSLMLAKLIKRYSRRPRLHYGFDSFEGMPAATVLDTAWGVAADDTGWGTGTCAASIESVQETMVKGGVSDVVRLVKGYFEDTLPSWSAQIGPIAFLHMDADWYESTKTIFNVLYDQVIPKGFVQLDDFGHWQGCNAAVREFQTARRLTLGLQPVPGDTCGTWFTKSSVYAG